MKTLKDFAEVAQGTAWEKGDKQRVYFNFYAKNTKIEKDITAFIDFENGFEPELGGLCGGTLKVFCKNGIKRAKEAKLILMNNLNERLNLGLELPDDANDVIL